MTKIKFGKTITKIASSRGLTEVFDDFLKMTVCAFSFGRMEEDYERIAKKYDKDDLSLFSLALAEMIQDYDQAAKNGWSDVLGRFFEEVNSSASAQSKGQFFTPESLCNMMAKMTEENAPCRADITVSDPSSGSSRNLIAHSRLHPQNRMNAFYVAQDLDERCINMSVINMVMFGMKGIVIHMDTISMKIFKGYRVFLPETGLGVAPLTAEYCTQYLTAPKQEQTTFEADKVGQLKLF